MVDQKTKDQEGGCPDCDCEEIPDQDPKWGPWKRTPVVAKFKIGNCDYTVNSKVDIRRRIFDGICYEKELKVSSVPGFIEEFDATVVLGEGFELTGKMLAEIERVIKAQLG